MTTTAEAAASATALPGDTRWDRLERWVTLWRTQRPAHRKLRSSRLRHRLFALLGGRPIPEPVITELRQHARRTARLHRLKQLAVARKDEKALDRIELLLGREHGRHNARMKQLTAVSKPAEDGGP